VELEREWWMKRRRTGVALRMRRVVPGLQQLIRTEGARRPMKAVGQDASI
jgi:hypothetical protein